MEGAIIGASVAILGAVLASWRQLSSQIARVSSSVEELTNRLDRADLEGLRDRVTRLEARCPQCEEHHR